MEAAGNRDVRPRVAREPEAANARVAKCQRLERSEEAQDTAIMLPLFHDLQDVDQDRVIDAVIRSVTGRS